ncbi:hypothetical protein ACFB49_02210 [Sphingomonas sp. DBB INV C78]|uniref:uracil-DNA glycosylase n=1 Tax=Sphingomonas sp. DBB INV C78 TaxID=3349434 RepID=UPI0036D34E0E
MTIDVLSAIDWWCEAGVDVLVDEAPRDWLTVVRPAATVTAAEPVTASPVADSLTAIQTLYASDPIFGPVNGRLAPAGDVASGLMLLCDQPEPGDAEAGQIIAGAAGMLLDRMLAAIGRDRASIYLATMTPARVPGGRPSPKSLAAWSDLAHRHVDLAAPKALLLFGDAASRAFLGVSLADARGTVHHLNREGRRIAAVATFHPRFLLQQPARKADAWRDLRLLLGEVSQ